jgi:uncharacterized membrane protein
MAFCSKCGAEASGGAVFCAKCGQPLASPVSGAIAPTTPDALPVAAGGELSMPENVAGLLCYSLGWITGLIFFLIDKRPTVRFHAAQSIFLFGGLSVIVIVLGSLASAGWMMGGFFFGTWALGAVILGILRLVGFVFWILLMVKAYQGEKYRVPVAADWADKLARK